MSAYRIDVRRNKSLWPGRPQRFSWRAVNVGNGKVIARSSENYTNAGDCEDAATKLFSGGSRVGLVRADGSQVILRESTE